MRQLMDRHKVIIFLFQQWMTSVWWSKDKKQRLAWPLNLWEWKVFGNMRNLLCAIITQTLKTRIISLRLILFDTNIQRIVIAFCHLFWFSKICQLFVYVLYSMEGLIQLHNEAVTSLQFNDDKTNVVLWQMFVKIREV